MAATGVLAPGSGRDFLLGLPDSYSQSSGGFIDARAREYYFYAQDEFKLRQDLTLTYGMGYQIDTPLKDIFNGGRAINCYVAGQQSAIYPTAPVGMNFPGDPNCSTAAGYSLTTMTLVRALGLHGLHNLGRISGDQGNFSIRGGFGMYYNRSEEELTLQNLLAARSTLFDTESPTRVDCPVLAHRLATSGAVNQSGASITCSLAFRSHAESCIYCQQVPVTPPPARAARWTLRSSTNHVAEPARPTNQIPMAMNYNLTVQREIPGQIILSSVMWGRRRGIFRPCADLNPLHPAGLRSDSGVRPCFPVSNPASETLDPTTGAMYNGQRWMPVEPAIQ